MKDTLTETSHWNEKNDIQISNWKTDKQSTLKKITRWQSTVYIDASIYLHLYVELSQFDYSQRSAIKIGIIY